MTLHQVTLRFAEADGGHRAEMSTSLPDHEPGSAPAPAPTALSDEPLGAVVHRLSEQIPELVRSEIRLAQAELTEKGKRAGVGVGLYGAAGVIALYGVGVLIALAIILLDLVLPLWLAALIVTVFLFATAAVAGLMGKKEVSAATPAAPEKAIAGVKEDVAVVKGAQP